MYSIIADLHTHSIASTHAYSTIAEMVHAAKKKGLAAIGITDHGHRMPGAPGPWYFENLHQLPLRQEGVLTILGMETNVLDFAGTLDYKTHDRLDFLIASIHNIPGISLENPTLEKCTGLYLALAKDPRVHVIGHSGTPEFKYDYARVIPALKAAGKLIEINSHTFDVRASSVENCREIALLCKQYAAPILVSSDAHFHTEVGNFTKALALLRSIDFPEELIVNANEARLLAYLKKHTNIETNRPN